MQIIRTFCNAVLICSINTACPALASAEPKAIEATNQKEKVLGNKLTTHAQTTLEKQNPEKENETLLAEIERKPKESRLKIWFLDVNSLLENVGSTLDWSANWIDGQFVDDEAGKNKAKTWGHISVGWVPQNGDWGNYPVKFKVRAKLPNLKNRVELIFTDNEEADLNTLPYESARPEAFRSSQNSLGAAVRFLHKTSDKVSSSTRVGWGESQIYTRSSIIYRRKYLDERVTLNAQPAIEYYAEDGLGARLILDAGYKFTERHELRLNYGLLDRESFDHPKWRKGIFHLTELSKKSAVIVGATAAGEVEPEYKPKLYRFSVRVRRKSMRSWIFLEAEPFIEFTRDRIIDDATNDYLGFTGYERNIGFALRLEAHYGFL